MPDTSYVMTFATSTDKTRRFSVRQGQPSLTAPQAQSAAMKVLTANALDPTKSGALVALKKLERVDVTKTELDIA